MTHNLPPLSFNRRMTSCMLGDTLRFYDEHEACVAWVSSMDDWKDEPEPPHVDK